MLRFKYCKLSLAGVLIAMLTTVTQAQDTMQIPRDPMQAYLDEHIYFSKEASSGGSGVGGGGCGCN